MSTDDRPKHFQILTSQLWVEVFRLVGAVGASKLIAESSLTLQATNSLSDLSTLYAESEVSRLLVSIASISRNLLDANAEYAAQQVLSLSTPVGQLTDDLDNPSGQRDLYFREACNKILHTTQVQFDRQVVRATGQTFITSQVVLLGTYRGHDWRAEIDLIMFAEYAKWIL